MIASADDEAPGTERESGIPAGGSSAIPQNDATVVDQVVTQHALAVEKTNERRDEAEKALSALRKFAAPGIDDAIMRFRRWQHEDPFPEIPTGLLSCSDFCTYIMEAGVVFPDCLSVKALELASLDLPLLGKAVWFDDRGERHEITIEKGTAFRLRRNSIAFVSLEPYLQLPDYIAMRFNLKVQHVYRGLLLGTGPLVDPGYQGYLAIPLHNLTDNDYVFQGGDRLIAVEFTKLAPNIPPIVARIGSVFPVGEPIPRVVRPFREPELPRPNAEKEHPIRGNFSKARVDEVASSLPTFDVKIAALKRRVRLFTYAGLVAGAALVFTALAVILQAMGEIRAVDSREQDLLAKHAVAQARAEDSLKALAGRVGVLEHLLCVKGVSPTAAKSTEQSAHPPTCR